MNQVLFEYYRLPDAAMEFSLRGSLSGNTGYFKCGDDIICFGRCSTGYPSKTAAGELYDALVDIDQEGTTVKLPFLPNEIISNLRYERYAKGVVGSRTDALRAFVKNAYYLLRPALPLSVRRPLQKIHLNRWNKIPFPQWPVDRTVDCLVQQLLKVGMRAKGLKQVPFIWFWPNGASACAMMTHDVESRSGQSFCSQLMDINDEFGIPASFQIVPKTRYPVSDGFVQGIWDRGFEVAIHDLNHDGRLFGDEDEFQRRALQINEYGRRYRARGFRSAVLYRNQDWYDALDFEYDMSVPNVAHLDPQRGGCCTVMPYFNGKILELPLTTTQDYSLFHILNDYSLSLWERQIEIILQQHGLISFIAHPDYLIAQRAQGIYRQLLDFLRELNAKRNVWIARPQEVNDWWRTRAQLRLKQHQGGWQIEGPGNERARVALATVTENDGVGYSICP